MPIFIAELIGGGSVTLVVRRNTMEPHLRVKLLTTPTVLDGRRSPITTGYRPQFRYRGQDNDVSITIPGDKWIEPGDSTDALLSFYRPELQQSLFQLGSSFTLA